MSAIKTINSNLIRSLLVDDFNVGLLVADADRRKELAAIEPEEVDELIGRLNDVKAYIATAQEERRREAWEVLQGILTEQSMFTTVEELIEAATGGNGSHTNLRTVVRGTSSNSNNKTFAIELYDTVSGKTYQGRSTNKKITFSEKQGKEAYEALLTKDSSMKDFDTFMRKFSKEYTEAYPFNAHWNGNDFHLNSRGKLNEVSTKYFEEFKKKDKTGDDEKALLAKFKAKVTKE